LIDEEMPVSSGCLSCSSVRSESGDEEISSKISSESSSETSEGTSEGTSSDTSEGTSSGTSQAIGSEFGESTASYSSGGILDSLSDSEIEEII
jgi:hypothetical protein